MIIEDLFEYILDLTALDDMRIPDQYISGFAHLIEQFNSLNFIIPVDTAFSCILFILSFALACGLIKVVIHK